jgi:hypothetical protein
MNAACAIPEPGGARAGEVGRDSKSLMAVGPGRPQWRELSDERSVRDPRAQGRSRCPQWRELSDERSVRDPRAQGRSRWRAEMRTQRNGDCKPGGARASGRCQVNAAGAIFEPGGARVAR